MRKINKGRLRSGTKLDDMAFSYQLIKTMTKLEKETRQQLYVFIKNDEIPDNSARIHLHAGMTFQLSYHTVQLQA